METTPEHGMTRASEYELDTLTIVASTGTAIDIKQIMVELNLYEDLFANVTTGDLLIADTQNLCNTLPLVGHEYLMMSFKKAGQGKAQSYTKTFRIYRMADRRRTGLNTDAYILHFCSEELILNDVIRISKSYHGKTIESIIKDIAINYLKIDTQKFSETSTTFGAYDFVIPSWKPFQTINWLANRALGPLYKSATFLFYETRQGFRFTDLETLVQRRPVESFIFAPKAVNLGNDEHAKTDLELAVAGVESYTIRDTFNTLQLLQTGGLAGSLLTVDPLRQRITMSTYTLPGQWDKTKHLNAKALSSTAPTRLGSGLTDHPQTFRRLFLTTAGHDTMTYGRGRQVRRPNDVEQWMIPRNMYLSLLQQAKIEVLLPGHPTVQVGDVVSFDLPAAAMKDHATADSDQVFSGRYLVTACRHKIDRDKHACVLELVKDSIVKAFVSPATTNASLKKVKTL